MPRGSKPGERRGGRQKGTPNKKAPKVIQTGTAFDTAVQMIPHDVIDAMKPAEFLDLAWKLLAKAGFGQAAASIAEKAAPYFSPKLASETHRNLTDDSHRTETDLRRELDEISAHEKGADQAGTVAPPVPEQPDRLVH